MRRLAPFLFLLAAGCAATPEAPGASDALGVSVARADLDPVLGVTALDGGALDLSADLEAGRSVALVFWQTWCASCKREAPELVAAARALGDDVRFVGVIPGVVDDEDVEKVRDTAEEWELPYAQVLDTDLALTRAFGVQRTPTIVVLGRGPRVLWRGTHAPDDWRAVLGTRP